MDKRKNWDSKFWASEEASPRRNGNVVSGDIVFETIDPHVTYRNLTKHAFTVISPCFVFCKSVCAHVQFHTDRLYERSVSWHQYPKDPQGRITFVGSQCVSLTFGSLEGRGFDNLACQHPRLIAQRHTEQVISFRITGHVFSFNFHFDILYRFYTSHNIPTFFKDEMGFYIFYFCFYIILLYYSTIILLHWTYSYSSSDILLLLFSIFLFLTIILLLCFLFLSFFCRNFLTLRCNTSVGRWAHFECPRTWPFECLSCHSFKVCLLLLFRMI